jgi:hypothetical protein
VLIFGVHADHPRAAHVRATAGAELFVPALNQFVLARELAAADANGKAPAHIETHVTVAELDGKGDLRGVRFYLLTPDKNAANRGKIGSYTPRRIPGAFADPRLNSREIRKRDTSN